MAHSRRIAAVLIGLVLVALAPAPMRRIGASVRQAASPALDDKARAEVIDALSRELHRTYVFSDKAAAMEKDLRARLSQHGYDGLNDSSEFAQRLTEHLQAITLDKHLRVRAGAPPPGRPAGDAPRSPFGEFKRLDGNVAYVEITSFGMSADQARADVRVVMSQAADAAALILDVRRNGGGNPDTVALVSSYLFGAEPVHLNSLYWRPANRTDDFFTDPHVEGAKFGQVKPVYVLTSARTFSAAEEFTYNLQARKRATIVGERTGGGAHPGGFVPLPHGLGAFVPSGRAINPITKTNWEGTGVAPDVVVAADAALGAAHTLVLKAVSAATARH